MRPDPGRPPMAKPDERASPRIVLVVVAVFLLVTGVVVSAMAIVGGQDEPLRSGPVSRSAPPELARVLNLFPGSESPAADTPDVVRTQAAGSAARWPDLGCPIDRSGLPSPAQFVTGSERGPEYERARVVATYDKAATAREAYDLVVQGMSECQGDQVPLAPEAVRTAGVSDPHAAGVVLVIGAPVTGDEPRPVSLVGVATSGRSLVVAIDLATFYPGSVPGPADATPPVQGVAWLLGQVCVVDETAC